MTRPLAVDVSLRRNRSHRVTQSPCRVAHGVELGTFCHLNWRSSPAMSTWMSAHLERVVQKFPSAEASSHCTAKPPGVATFFHACSLTVAVGPTQLSRRSRSQLTEPSIFAQKSQPESEKHTRHELKSGSSPAKVFRPVEVTQPRAASAEMRSRDAPSRRCSQCFQIS